MPTYDYRCDLCGDFAAIRRMAERDAACACPACGRLAQRALSMPSLALMAGTRRAAHQTNERAAHAPHRHGPGCGCSGKASSKAATPPGALKSSGGGRPWMISH